MLNYIWMCPWYDIKCKNQGTNLYTLWTRFHFKILYTYILKYTPRYYMVKLQIIFSFIIVSYMFFYNKHVLYFYPPQKKTQNRFLRTLAMRNLRIDFKKKKSSPTLCPLFGLKRAQEGGLSCAWHLALDCGEFQTQGWIPQCLLLLSPQH